MQNPRVENLKARLILHRDQLPPWKIHAGLKALSRLGHVPAASYEDLSARHADLVADLAHSTRSDETQVLSEIQSLRALPAPLAQRIAAQTATLEDVIFALDYRTDLGSEAARLRGVVERLARRATGLPKGGEARIPARLRHIDKLLVNLSHADFGLAVETWSSFCSKLRRAVEFVDSDGRRRLRTSSLSGEWRRLVEHIKATAGNGRGRGGLQGQLAKLWPLIAFAEQRRVEPAEIDDAAIEAFLADCVTEELADPFETTRNVIYAWEHLQKNVPGFPSQKLRRIYRQGHERDHRPLEDLSEALQVQWADFWRVHERKSIGAMKDMVRESDAPQDETPRRAKLGRANRIVGTIAADRWPSLTSAVVLAAHAALDCGREAQSLLDCLQPHIVERALEQMIERKRRKIPDAPEKSSSLKGLAQNLLTIARLTSLPETSLKAIENLRDDVNPTLIRIETGRDGKPKRIYTDFRMGPRHRERLEQFNETVKLHAWFSMLPKLHARMRKIIGSGMSPTEEDVNDSIVAVLHAITQSCPIRNANLAKMTISGKQPWLRLPRIKGDSARVVIPTAFVKNRKEINMELTPDAVAVVEDYLQYFRPVLVSNVGADADNDFLFPAEGRKHRHGVHLNRVFLARNWSIGGIAVNLHVQRHITAKIILDADPSQMSLVQILLDHKSIRTTESFYSAVNQIIAQRKFHDLVARRRKALQDLVDRGNPRHLSRRLKMTEVDHIYTNGSEP